jgi:hypothetical protein
MEEWKIPIFLKENHFQKNHDNFWNGKIILANLRLVLVVLYIILGWYYDILGWNFIIIYYFNWQTENKPILDQ